MTLEERLNALAAAIGADHKATRLIIGDTTTLATADKSSVVKAVNELKAAVDGLAGGGGAPIDDNAGDGDTTSTWSADKIHDMIELAKQAVKDDLTSGAGAALDTLKELADALNNDPNFYQTIANGMAKRVRVDAPQTFTAAEKTQARENIDAYGAAEIGNPDADLVATYTTAKA